jgi:4-nitrophenyl phosphatase
VRGNIVCDLDGVVYRGKEPIDGAAAALRALTAAGFRLVFASNNSTKSPAAMARDIADRTGFAAEEDQVVNSAAAAAYLLTGSAPAAVYVIGEPGLRSTLRDAGVEVIDDAGNATAVVVGMDRSFDYSRLRDAANAVRRGARFVATNTDATFPTPDGVDPGGGTMVAAISVAANATPEVAGKPHAPIRELIATRLGPGPTWVVGDRPETDLSLGLVEGWTKVLVLSGITSDPASVPAELRPDLVLDSIAELPAALVQPA